MTPKFEVINEAQAGLISVHVFCLSISLSAELFFPLLTVNKVQN